MALEARCAVRFGKQASDGKARLEATVVGFSDSLSGLKMVIPVAQRKKKR